MSVTLYFSKINLNSHILNVYEEPEKLRNILTLLGSKINNDIEYVKEEIGKDENGEVFVYTATYKFSSIQKMGDQYDDGIVGSVIKKSNIYIKNIDEETGKIKKFPVENSEVVQFYFDVYRETVAYYQSNRFGYADFNQAFKELINKAMESNDEKYYFEVSTIRKGLNIEMLESQLKDIGMLESLKIEIIPPNPDDTLLDSVHNNGEEFLEAVKEGNLTSRSILFTSKAPGGMFLNAKIIDDEIKKIGSIHSKLGAEEAVKKGYANVEAVSKDGRAYTTKNNHPIKDKIDGHLLNNINFFAEACKKKILSLRSTS